MKANYITPRIAILKVTSLHDLQSFKQNVYSRHKNYFHLFNLTNVKLPSQKETNFKWRGIPFSITEIIKLLSCIDTFLRMNLANTAFLIVSNQSMEEFAKAIVKSYLNILIFSIKESPPFASILHLSKTIITSHPYFFRQIQYIYKSISITYPPLKILQNFTITPEIFIPIVQINTEGRYNDFDNIYKHPIEQQLANYYLNLNRPLQTSIGRKYYDNRPQTKYFIKPIIVSGDVKINVFSYKTIKKVYQFTIGFNTLCLDTLSKEKGNKIILENRDLYDWGQGKQEIRVEIEYSDYCQNEKCKKYASCQDCREMIKKMGNRYVEIQGELQKLQRTRTLQEVHTLLSI